LSGDTVVKRLVGFFTIALIIISGALCVNAIGPSPETPALLGRHHQEKRSLPLPPGIYGADTLAFNLVKPMLDKVLDGKDVHWETYQRELSRRRMTTYVRWKEAVY
jgi:hypothetical protein